MKSKAVVICYIFTWLWLAALAALGVMMPSMMQAYMRWRVLSQEVCTVVLIAFYICCVPVLTALICVLRILRMIRQLKMFTKDNILMLRIISWCCILAAAVCFAAGFWYFPLLFVTVAALFIYLICRVVCTCFIAATQLQEENSLTI